LAQRRINPRAASHLRVGIRICRLFAGCMLEAVEEEGGWNGHARVGAAPDFPAFQVAMQVLMRDCQECSRVTTMADSTCVLRRGIWYANCSGRLNDGICSWVD
jgi:hypothetical protein